MEAVAQATPIPRAKGGEESSSKKGYEYGYDEVTYMHNLYYGQLKFLKTAKDLLNDILDSATNPDIILNTEVKLEGITESLKRWEAIQPAISLVEAFDIIKKVKYTYAPLCYRRYCVSLAVLITSSIFNLCNGSKYIVKSVCTFSSALRLQSQ